MIIGKKWVLPAMAAFVMAACAPSNSDEVVEEVAPDSTPTVIVETTMGQFVIEVDLTAAPRSAANFLYHVNGSFYNGLQFHRVMTRPAIIQTGRLTANYEPREAQVPFLENEDTGLLNVRGAVAVARAADPHSAKSEWFINVQDNPLLNHDEEEWGYAVFGRVVGGMDVVDLISAVPTRERGTRKDVPVDPVVIERMYVDNEWQPAEPEEEGGN